MSAFKNFNITKIELM